MTEAIRRNGYAFSWIEFGFDDDDDDENGRWPNPASTNRVEVVFNHVGQRRVGRGGARLKAPSASRSTLGNGLWIKNGKKKEIEFHQNNNPASKSLATSQVGPEKHRIRQLSNYVLQV